MKKLIRKSFNYLGYDIVKKAKSYPADMDKKFWRIYKSCKNNTMVPLERMYSLYKSVEYIINSKIPGDFVECGVWKGGCAMIIAMTLALNGETNRKIYLYDTYAGMAKPTKEDVNIFSKLEVTKKWNKLQKNKYNDWCYSPLKEVKNNLKKTGYPQNNLVFVKGKVEDTIPSTLPSKISLLRLDTDWYESTNHEMVHLFPLLVKKGILIIDDYGCWAGSRKAVNEYLKNNKVKILLNRTDNFGGRVGVKI